MRSDLRGYSDSGLLRRGRSLQAGAAVIGATLLFATGSARALTTMTMDDLPTQPVDGLSHLGVTFSYTESGSPSTDAVYNSPTGPVTTTHTTDPSLHGDTVGVLQIDFDNPTSVLEMGFAVSVTTSEIEAVAVELFDPALNSLGTTYINVDPGSFAFASGLFENTSGACVRRAIVTFDSFGDAFVMDNLTYEEAAPCGCSLTPSACVTGFAKGQLLVNEKKEGNEKLTAKFLKGPLLLQSDFGNPVGGSTSYQLCVYDEAGDLVGDLSVDRAGDTCSGKDCWKAVGGAPPDGKGFKYKDKALADDGALLINVKGGSPGRSKAIFKAKNKSGTMPTGIASTLNGSASATIQLLPSDGQCISVTVSDVVKDDGNFFKAK